MHSVFPHVKRLPSSPLKSHPPLFYSLIFSRVIVSLNKINRAADNRMDFDQAQNIPHLELPGNRTPGPTPMISPDSPSCDEIQPPQYEVRVPWFPLCSAPPWPLIRQRCFVYICVCVLLLLSGLRDQFIRRVALTRWLLVTAAPSSGTPLPLCLTEAPWRHAAETSPGAVPPSGHLWKLWWKQVVWMTM